MRILVVGEGGREHAIAWRLAADPDVAEVLVAPGNDGIARAHRTLPMGAGDHAALLDACRAERIDLVVVGPEAPLAAGLADQLRAGGVATYGPGAEAARLESSKSFAKSILSEAAAPTARAESFESLEPARAALAPFGPPGVIKADGLAAGKGVLVTADRGAAERFLAECLTGGRFGDAARRLLIEEHLEGEEASLMAICDGRSALALVPARDYKRAHDGDAGPNTGGMGAVAPHPAMTPELERVAMERIVLPVLDRMVARGTPFHGTLYAGLMLTAAGPKALEFNVRFGDPEAEVVLPLVEGPLAAMLLAAARGRPSGGGLRRAADAAVAVALVDEGYPEAASGGGVIEGLDALERAGEVRVFHAGTAWRDGRWVVRGGRAVYVVARAASREAAREKAYAAIATLGGRGWRCRRDVAADGAAAVTAARRGG
jgi:phosphoribosylamine--glycine ligase